MAKTTSDNFKEQKNTLGSQPIHLFTVEDYDSAGNSLHWAAYPSSVEFDGVTYDPAPISFDSVKENNSGQIDTTTVTVSNVTRIIGGYLEAYDLKGKMVVLKTVFANRLGESDAYIDDVYFIDSYSMDAYNVSFVLTSKFDVLSVQLPMRKFTRTVCAWKFKSAECGYTGAGDHCQRLKQNCQALGNYDRFGAFPSVPQRRVVIT